MTPADDLTFDDITQPISEWALDYGITPELIVARLERGMTVADAITSPMVAAKGQQLTGAHIDAYLGVKPHRADQRRRPPIRQGRRFTFNDRSLTAKQWAEELGVTSCMIYQRLRLSGTVFPRPPRKRVGKRYECNGDSLTLAEWSAKLGITVATIRGRLRAGLPPEVVFASRRPEHHNSRLYTFNGETHSLMAWSRLVGVSRTALGNRLKKGWSIERALTTPSRNKRRPGVASNLEAMAGTGAGSTAQEMPETDFSEQDQP